MKRLLFTISLVSFSAFILISSLPQTVHSDSKQGITDTTVKLGLFSAMTGPNAPFGLAMYGAKSVYDDVNEKGGIHGRKIVTFLEDDACAPEKCAAAVKKLIFDEKVAVLHGGNCSLAIMGAKNTIAEAGIPYVVAGAAMDAIASPVVRNIFNPCLPASVDGVAMMDFIASKPGTKKVAIARHPDEWAMTRYRPMLKRAEELNIKIVADEVLDRQVTDATAQVLKIKRANPDAVMMLLYPLEGGVLLRNAFKFGLNVPFLSTTVTSDIRDFNNKVGLPAAMKNFYTLSGFKGSIFSEEMSKWIKLLEKYYPNVPKEPSIFYGIQGAMVISKALTDAGKDLSWDRIINAIENIKNYDTGAYWARASFSPQDHHGVKSGSFVTLVGEKELFVGDKWKEIKK